MNWLDRILSIFKPAVPIKPVVITPALVTPKQITKPDEIVTIPQCGLDLIRELEGCRLEAYLDTRSIPTIGYGHTDSVRLGDTCTEAQAEAWLKFDTTWAWEAVCRNVRVPLTSYQGGALLSFVYNLGAFNFVHSRLLRVLNNGNYGEVAPEMKVWIWSTLPDKTRVVNNGLVNRRRKEAALWLNNDWRQV